ncbi:MAG: hypothetical protein ACLRSA_03480 [Streptococcus salivarius]
MFTAGLDSSRLTGVVFSTVGAERRYFLAKDGSASAELTSVAGLAVVAVLAGFAS